MDILTHSSPPRPTHTHTDVPEHHVFLGGQGCIFLTVLLRIQLKLASNLNPFVSASRVLA